MKNLSWKWQYIQGATLICVCWSGNLAPVFIPLSSAECVFYVKIVYIFSISPSPYPPSVSCVKCCIVGLRIMKVWPYWSAFFSLLLDIYTHHNSYDACIVNLHLFSLVFRSFSTRLSLDLIIISVLAGTCRDTSHTVFHFIITAENEVEWMITLLFNNIFLQLIL